MRRSDECWTVWSVPKFDKLCLCIYNKPLVLSALCVGSQDFVFKRLGRALFTALTLTEELITCRRRGGESTSAHFPVKYTAGVSCIRLSPNYFSPAMKGFVSCEGLQIPLYPRHQDAEDEASDGDSLLGHRGVSTSIQPEQEVGIGKTRSQAV